MRVKGGALERNKPRDITETLQSRDFRGNPFIDTINYNFAFGDSVKMIKTHDSAAYTSALGLELRDVSRD